MRFGKLNDDTGPVTWLKVREGCYARISDVCGVSIGMKDAEDGTEILPPTVVSVHLVNGSFAAFEECASPAEAIATADALVLALEENDRLLREAAN